MRFAPPLLLVAVLLACSEPATSPATAPVRPLAYVTTGGRNPGFPPPPPAALTAGFDADAGATSSPITAVFDLNTAGTSGSVSFPTGQPAGTMASPDAAVLFHNDGSLTGQGTLAVTLTAPAGTVVKSLARSAAAISLHPGTLVVVIDLHRTLVSEHTTLTPSCLATPGQGTCARIRVYNALLYDGKSAHPSFISGYLMVDAVRVHTVP